MSWLTDADPLCTDPAKGGAVDLVVEPGVKDLGGFRVRRALPAIRRRMVGPFIFLDHMGPTRFDPGQGLDVRPHPHIGLATLTYLTDGTIWHRDSLGSRQEIVPGDVNWMTAGRGVVHSERSPRDRALPHTTEGIQSWVALPKAQEETAPGFFHHAGATLPILRDTGLTLRLIAGTGFGMTSPVEALWHMVYADATLDANTVLRLPDEHAERAVYVLAGSVEIAGESFPEHRLLVFRPGDGVAVRAKCAARLLVLGGEPMDGPRHIWWNFVSSSKDRIEAAKSDWKSGRFGAVPGDAEFIPLPE